MLMFDCWVGGGGRGRDVDVCKKTRIRNTFTRFRNKNQRSKELTEFDIIKERTLFYIREEFVRIVKLRIIYEQCKTLSLFTIILF